MGKTYEMKEVKHEKREISNEIGMSVRDRKFEQPHFESQLIT